MHSAIHAPWGLLSAGLALLLLPGAALGSGSNSDSNSVAVVFLVFLLLLLLLVLALAWRKLSHDSDGRYHPRHLCQPHRLLAALARRWRELRGQVPPERHWQGKDDDEDEDDDEEEETLQRDEEEGGGGQEEQSEEEGTAVPEGTPPRDAPEGALEEAGEAESASAGGLLSDLHSFSGTAAWEDNTMEGGSRQHVTAL
uniref:Protein tyrosine phosphatase receptor type C associated protein n=1 Tax=Chelydra serpentina TaxID=8475 RepID=A0A8C3XWK7_CHESE